MAGHQTFFDQFCHLTDQTKFDQTNLLYIINGEISECIIGKQTSRQFSTLIIGTTISVLRVTVADFLGHTIIVIPKEFCLVHNIQ